MRQPVPAQNKPGARRETPGARHETAPKGPRIDLKVRYYYRMKPQRVYPLTVEVPRGSLGRLLPGGSGEAVTVRPLIPGAVVVPAEQRLDVARPGSQATFAVTPLAKGRLANARVDVIQHGRVTQQIGLGMKGVTQRLTWWLLALTIVVPSLLLYYGSPRYHPLSGNVPHKVTAPPREDNKGGAADADNKEQGADKKPPAAGKDDKAAEPGAKDDKEQAGPPGGRPTPPPIRPGQPVETSLPGGPGDVLTYKIDRTLSSDVPGVPYINEEPKIPGIDATAGAAASKGLGQAYDLYIGLADSHVSFWIGVFLLLLTFLSWMTHSTGRTSRRGAVELVPAPAGGHAQETLPLGPSGPPLSVEPA